MQLGVEPAELSQLDERVDRPGELPVDERYRQAIAGDDVPRCDVAVPGHLRRPAEVAAVPREPGRAGVRAERARRLVQVAQHVPEGCRAIGGPRSRLDELAFD